MLSLMRSARPALVALALVSVAVGAGWLLFRQTPDERYAVRWESIELSEDRRTIRVVTSYPTEGFCVKEPDGIDVEVRDSTAVVAAWMSGPAPGGDLVCTAECGLVAQTVTLDDPLPESVERFEPVAKAVEGCWR